MKYLVTLGLLSIGIAGAFYLAYRKIDFSGKWTSDPLAEPKSLGELDIEIFGDSDPVPEDEDHIVYFGTPWGQVLWVHFDSAQWEMLNTVAELNDQTLEHTLEEIVQERFGSDPPASL